MNETQEGRRGEPSLEPWALELEGRTADPNTCQELSRVVALLRNLPEPESSGDLAERVLARVARERSRPRLWRGLFHVVPDASPRLGLALAAGIALLLITASPTSLSSWLGFGDAAPRQVGVPGGVATVADASATWVAPQAVVRRVPRVGVLRPQFVSVYAPAPAARPRVAFERAAIDEAFDSRLDEQLNRLVLDPTAFALRLEQMPQRDSFIARLAERAAERGDAPEIALSVRRSPHPLAHQVVNRMLRATLVANAPR